MADKKKSSSDTENSRQKKGWGKKIFLIFFILCIIGGGGAYFYLNQSRPTPPAGSNLNTDVIFFVFNEFPEAYKVLHSLQEEISITEKEIERMQSLEEQFPAQNRIISDEKKKWEKNLKQLTQFRNNYEQELTTFYVSYQVASKIKEQQSDPKKDTLTATATDLISDSKTLTDKIREKQNNRSFWEKITHTFF